MLHDAEIRATGGGLQRIYLSELSRVRNEANERRMGIHREGGFLRVLDARNAGSAGADGSSRDTEEDGMKISVSRFAEPMVGHRGKDN